MREQITDEKVIETLEAIVAEKGEDYVYEYVTVETEYGGELQVTDCTYTDQAGAPSCIVGHVFARLTPKLLERVREVEWDEGAQWPMSRAVTELRWEGYLEDYTGEAFEYLRQAQYMQDGGDPWGDVIEEIKEEYSKR